jgi:hypothetical protein
MEQERNSFPLCRSYDDANIYYSIGTSTLWHVLSSMCSLYNGMKWYKMIGEVHTLM